MGEALLLFIVVNAQFQSALAYVYHSYDIMDPHLTVIALVHHTAVVTHLPLPPPLSLAMHCSGEANQSDAVLVELKQKGFLWDSLIASVSSPLKFVPYSSQVTS